MKNPPIPKKSLGQHWLYDSNALDAIAEAAEVEAGDHVLEVGPGTGALTEILLALGAHVTAVELDEHLYNELGKPGAFYGPDNERLQLINQDILSFDFTTMPAGYKIVANIPYYLTSNLIKVISETSNRPQKAVLLIQKEVAERAAAQPGDMSLLSATAQFYWQIKLGPLVPAKLFTPPPKVDSQALILDKRLVPLFDDVEPKQFFRLVKAGFSQRRKTLLNSLSAGLQLDKNIVKTVCDSVDISPGRRPQTLSLEEWHNLYISLNT
jgi:16S rRNA (adenine1518-N6/adenine1519-N6)-dimethyltransferase